MISVDWTSIYNILTVFNQEEEDQQLQQIPERQIYLANLREDNLTYVDIFYRKLLKTISNTYSQVYHICTKNQNQVEQRSESEHSETYSQGQVTNPEESENNEHNENDNLLSSLSNSININGILENLTSYGLSLIMNPPPINIVCIYQDYIWVLSEYNDIYEYLYSCIYSDGSVVFYRDNNTNLAPIETIWISELTLPSQTGLSHPRKLELNNESRVRNITLSIVTQTVTLKMYLLELLCALMVNSYTQVLDFDTNPFHLYNFQLKQRYLNGILQQAR